MINHLATLLAAFPGSSNHTRCFMHILNLVAKCIMKQFDTLKKKKHSDDDLDDTNEDDVTDLQVALDELEEELENDDFSEDTNEWEFNMHIELTEEQINELEETLKPV
jgi:hypothetical protein